MRSLAHIVRCDFAPSWCRHVSVKCLVLAHGEQIHTGLFHASELLKVPAGTFVYVHATYAHHLSSHTRDRWVCVIEPSGAATQATTYVKVGNGFY